MKRFNKNSTLKEVYTYPGFEGMESYLGLTPKEVVLKDFPNQTLENFADTPSHNRNAEDIAAGLNTIAQLVENQVPVLQKFYTKEEIDKDMTKSEAALFWFPAKKKGPFAIVCSGGAYLYVANPSEAFPVAKHLKDMDISVFVLKYRAGMEGAVQKAQEDLHRAIGFIMENADKFQVEKKYSAFGFSAGGHLVAELGTDNKGYKAYGLPKPQMLGLGYPLVAFDGIDQGIKKIMFGEEEKEELQEEYTPIHHLNTDYPPTFIWHTVEDATVPFETNGAEIYRLLTDLKIPSTLKRVEHGPHGLGLGRGSEAEGWLDEAVAFWKEQMY